MTRNSGVLRGVILAVLATMITLMGGLVNPASAADAPPPVQVDRCGRVQDQVLIPSPGDGTTYYINGSYAAPGAHDVATPSVTIDVYGWTAQTYTFTYTDVACPPQATDTVDVVVGQCDPSSGFTYITVPYTNVEDASDLPKRNVEATYTSVNEEFRFLVGTVLDGQQVNIGTNTQDPTRARLLPGTWKVVVRSDGYLLTSASVFIAKCGDDEVPEGDPSGTGPFDPNAKPTGTLKQVAGTTKMRAVMVNKSVATPTTFRLVVDPVKGKTVTQSFEVASGKSKVRKYLASPRAKVVLSARFLVKQPNGQSRMKWQVLARALIS